MSLTVNNLNRASCCTILLFMCVVACLVVSPVGKTQESEFGRMGVEFRCPEYPIACCEPMKLQADVFATKDALGQEALSSIRFSWEATGGKVISGTRTNEVTVYPDIHSAGVQNVNVILKLDGGPPYLVREKSCVLAIDSRCVVPTLFDEFNQLSRTEESARLDRLARHLSKQASNFFTFLIAYAGRDSCFWEAELWSERAKNYLIDKHAIQPDRVVAVDGGFREHSTMELFTSPTSCGPFSKPTLLGSAANVKKSCGDKYKRGLITR